MLRGHEPYPAIAVDRRWTLVAANRAAGTLLAGVAPSLLQPPVNVLRIAVHPDGLAPRIANLAQWRAHLLERLHRQVEISADPALEELLAELRDYPFPSTRVRHAAIATAQDGSGVFVPLQLVTDSGMLSLISTTTVFGTPINVTIAEIALKCFFPADADTAERLRHTTG